MRLLRDGADDGIPRRLASLVGVGPTRFESIGSETPLRGVESAVYECRSGWADRDRSRELIQILQLVKPGPGGHRVDQLVVAFPSRSFEIGYEPWLQDRSAQQRR